MLESAIEGYLVKRVRAMRGRCLKIRGTRGWPDRLVLLPGVPMFFVETKRPKGGRFEPLQLRVHRLIQRIGHTVKVAYTKAEIDHLLQNL